MGKCYSCLEELNYDKVVIVRKGKWFCSDKCSVNVASLKRGSNSVSGQHLDVNDACENAPATSNCENCEGSGSVQTSCPDNKKGCLVYHAKPCPECSDKNSIDKHHKLLPITMDAEILRQANLTPETENLSDKMELRCNHDSSCDDEVIPADKVKKVLNEFLEEITEPLTELTEQLSKKAHYKLIWKQAEEKFGKRLMSELNEVKEDAKDI